MISKVIGHIEEKKWKLIFSFWFNGIGFYKWKQRNIKKKYTNSFWMGLKMKLRP